MNGFLQKVGWDKAPKTSEAPMIHRYRETRGFHDGRDTQLLGASSSVQLLTLVADPTLVHMTPHIPTRQALKICCFWYGPVYICMYRTHLLSIVRVVIIVLVVLPLIRHAKDRYHLVEGGDGLVILWSSGHKGPFDRGEKVVGPSGWMDGKAG